MTTYRTIEMMPGWLEIEVEPDVRLHIVNTGVHPLDFATCGREKPEVCAEDWDEDWRVDQILSEYGAVPSWQAEFEASMVSLPEEEE